MQVYLDESGNSRDKNTPVVSVGGCVASLEAWKVFEKNWRHVLAKFGATELHMKHFAHFHGEFAGWSETQRRSLLRDLVSIMHRSVSLYVGAAVPIPRYEAALSNEGQELRIDPYFGCLRQCVKAAIENAKSLPSDERVEIILADHPRFRARAVEAYEGYKNDSRLGSHRDRLGYLIPNGIPRDILPLQAADLVAYELGQELDNQLHHPDRAPRWPMRQLRRKECAFTVWTSPSII